MSWNNVNIDGYPEEGTFVLIAYEFGVGIALFVDGDWDTITSHRKHYIFTDKNRSYSSAQPEYWMPLPPPAKR